MAGNEEAGPSTTPTAATTAVTAASTPALAGSTPSQSVGMSGRAHLDLESAVKRLTDEELDMAGRATAAQELKELLEQYHNTNYGSYVEMMMPASIKALSSIPYSVHTDAPEQVSGRLQMNRVGVTFVPLPLCLTNFDLSSLHPSAVLTN